MRKNQMTMMEEFRRRKRLEDLHGKLAERQRKVASAQRLDELLPLDMHPDSVAAAQGYHVSNAERYFEPKRDELFDPNDFTMVFLASDSVTNVTSLNRVNSRRVLIFLGNGNGRVTYGKGKAEEYEQAFDNAMKKAR